jgi:hypothetical protein
MMLDAGSDSARLVAAARRSSLDVQRLRLLHGKICLRARDCALIGVLFSAGLLLTGFQLSESPLAKPRWSHVGIPATPAGKALAAVIDAFNAGDVELMNIYLGAYTPQEVSLRLDGRAGRLELLDIVSSEPLSIEYLVRGERDEATRIGRLDVADAAAILVTRSEFRSVPSTQL